MFASFFAFIGPFWCQIMALYFRSYRVFLAGCDVDNHVVGKRHHSIDVCRARYVADSHGRVATDMSSAQVLQAFVSAFLCVIASNYPKLTIRWAS